MLPENSDKQPRRPLSIWTRAAFFYAGIILPVICFLLAATVFSFKGDWQSGNLDDKACYLLVPPAALPFYPFLLHAMISLGLVLVDERRAGHFLVRLGIYTAPLLAAPYSLILMISIGSTPGITFGFLFGVTVFGIGAIFAGCALYVFLRWILPWLGRLAVKIPWRALKRRLLTLQWVAFLSITFFLLASGVYFTFEELFEVFGGTLFLFIFGSLAAAPFWALFTYIFMAVRIYLGHRSARQFSLSQVLALITWIGTYLAAWRWGVRLALIEYSKLPTEPPGGCYICTAAACGHPVWVGTQQILVGRQTYHVNDQMRHFKAAELGLRAAWPGVHRYLRAVYDWVGPLLAARLNHPVLADLAYVSLKPLEYAARLVLALIVPDYRRLAGRFYRSAEQPDG